MGLNAKNTKIKTLTTKKIHCIFEIQIYLKFRFSRIKVRVASEQSVVEGPGLGARPRGQGHFPHHRLLPASDTPDGITSPSDSASKPCLIPSLYLVCSGSERRRPHNCIVSSTSPSLTSTRCQNVFWFQNLQIICLLLSF